MRMWWICLSFLLFIGVHGEAVPKPTNNTTPVHMPLKQTVSFYVMADGPLGTRGRERFADQLQRLESRPEFVVHLGDVHERQRDCNLKHYDTAANDLLQHVHVPTFVIPGDADWYECSDKTAAWNKWSSRFLNFHQEWPSHSLDVRHQEDRPENFAFVHKGVLFIGLHVLYATVDEWRSWNELVHDDAVWLNEQLDSFAYADDVGAIVLFCHAYAHPRRYKEFYNDLVHQADDIGKPILYLQGDDTFVVDRIFPSSNILRVVLDTTRESDPTEITVNAFSAAPFQIKRRPLI